MKNKARIGIALLICIPLGLLSRTRLVYGLPLFQEYGGDVLWATMMYFIFALFFERWKRQTLVVSTLIFSYLIECSQLVQWEWLRVLRSTPLVYLLGQGFIWSDLLCYTIGVILAYVLDRLLIRKEWKYE